MGWSSTDVNASPCSHPSLCEEQPHVYQNQYQKHVLLHWTNALFIYGEVHQGFGLLDELILNCTSVLSWDVHWLTGLNLDWNISMTVLLELDCKPATGWGGTWRPFTCRLLSFVSTTLLFSIHLWEFLFVSFSWAPASVRTSSIQLVLLSFRQVQKSTTH